MTEDKTLRFIIFSNYLWTTAQKEFLLENVSMRFINQFRRRKNYEEFYFDETEMIDLSVSEFMKLQHNFKLEICQNTIAISIK